MAWGLLMHQLCQRHKPSESLTIQFLVLMHNPVQILLLLVLPTLRVQEPGKLGTITVNRYSYLYWHKAGTYLYCAIWHCEQLQLVAGDAV